jgi:hypothetical protein
MSFLPAVQPQKGVGSSVGARMVKLSVLYFPSRQTTPIVTFSIMARHGRGVWHGVQWNGKTATSFPLNETDENKAMQALLLTHPIEEAARPSDREIDANQKPVMSDHDKNLFIEQHNDG